MSQEDRIEAINQAESMIAKAVEAIIRAVGSRDKAREVASAMLADYLAPRRDRR